MSGIQYGNSSGFQTMPQVYGNIYNLFTLGQVYGNTSNFSTLYLSSGETLWFKTSSQIIGSPGTVEGDIRSFRTSVQFQGNIQVFNTVPLITGNINSFRTGVQFWGDTLVFKTVPLLTGNTFQFKTLDRTAWERGDWRKYLVREDLSKGKLDLLEYRSDGNYLTTYDEIDMAMGPEVVGTSGDTSRLWVVYRDKVDGAIYLARSNTDFTAWDYHTRMVRSPSGSSRPTLEFDSQGRLWISLELQPAGSLYKEIWLFQYPNVGSTLRFICQGDYPVLSKDEEGVFYLFYRATNGVIYHRESNDNYDSEYMVNAAGYPLGFFNPLQSGIGGFVDLRTFILFYNTGNEVQPRYIKTDDFYTGKPREELIPSVNVGGISWVDNSFYVSFRVIDELTKAPLEGARVVFKGIEKYTDSLGIVDYGKIGVLDSEEFQVTLDGFNSSGWVIYITGNVDILVELLGPFQVNEELLPSVSVGGMTWEDTRKTVTFIVSGSGGGRLIGILVKFDTREVYTNHVGVAVFPLTTSGVREYDISGSGYLPVEGSLDIQEDTTVEIEMQPDWDGVLREELDTNVSIESMTWEDMTYTVTFIVYHYHLNLPASGVQVNFNGEDKVTSGLGEVVFYNVRPHPTVDLYEYTLIHQDYLEPTIGQVKVGGYDLVKAITINCHIGSDMLPRSLDSEEIGASVALQSILWVEV